RRKTAAWPRPRGFMPPRRGQRSVHWNSARLSTGKQSPGGELGRAVGIVREDSWAMRLGLFGGTFDPIHLGHLILAEQCREACALDRVWFVVAGAPPHKQGERTAALHRLEMARIAIAGHPAFEVCDIETTRPGPHYSIDTLGAIH